MVEFNSMLTLCNRNITYQIVAIIIECIILLTVGFIILIVITGGFFIGQISLNHIKNPFIILYFSIWLRVILFTKFGIKKFIILLNPISYLVSMFLSILFLYIVNNYIAYITFDFSNFHDLALYNQAMFNFINGRGFLCPIWGDGSIFREHSEFFLIPISLIYFFWQSPLTLLYIQTFVVTSSVIPLYFLARLKLENNFLPLVICLSYLTFPGVSYLIRWCEFRSIVFVFPLLFTAFYFYELDKRNIFIILMLLAALVKEDVIPVVATTGLYILIFSKKKKINRKVGLIILLSSIVLFIFIIKVFIPSFRGAPYPHFTRFIDGGNIVNTILTNPLIFFTDDSILSQGKINYFFDLFLRLGFLPLFSFMILVPMSNWIQSILSPDASVISQIWHNIPIFTFLFISVLFGISNLKRIHKIFVNLVLFILPLIVVIFGFTSFKDKVINPFWSSEIFEKTLSIERYKRLKSAIEFIPKDKSIYVPFKLLPYVSSRERVYWYPKVGKGTAINWIDIDYILFSRDTFINSIDRDKLFEAIKSKIFIKVKNFGKFQVWKKKR